MITEGLEAVATFFDTVNKVLTRLWGTQTASQASLQARAEQAANKKHEALALLQQARNEGDLDAVDRYLSAVNGWDAELRRVREQAAAQRPGR